jgi:hypothetical protein
LLAGLCGAAGRAAESSREGERHLLMLQNDRIVVGLLPEVGGGVMVLRLPQGENVFLARPALWGEPAAARPDPAAPPKEYKAYFGHTVWVGPQSAWGWPPDPYWIYGRFQVTRQTAASVTMLGPKSPTSGFRLEKTVTLNPDGTVTFSVTGTNILGRPIGGDLWSNTRLPGAARAYVPLQGDGEVRLGCWFSESGRPQEALGASGINGFFTFRTREPMPAGLGGRVAKAFICSPKEGVIAAFSGAYVFLKRAAVVPKARLHPQAGFIEVYQATTAPGNRDQDPGLLELEMHGPYVTLQPGEATSFTETWQVLPYTGPDTDAAHTAFLKSVGIGAK